MRSGEFATMLDVANYLDFLVALDEHIASSSLGYVVYGHEMNNIAQAAGLVVAGDESAARWTGELVQLGYVVHNPPGLGDQRLVPRGAYTPDDLRRFNEYRITSEGRAEADRVRRQRREAITDAAIGGVLPNLVSPSMAEPERQAIAVPLGHLRSALDSEQYVGAVGAAKDMVEAVCKITLTRAGRPVPRAASLPTLFKEAVDASGIQKEHVEVGRSLAATVQRLAELRDAAGAGHGRAAQPEVTAGAARLAASAAAGITLLFLGPE